MLEGVSFIDFKKGEWSVRAGSCHDGETTYICSCVGTRSEVHDLAR